MFTIKVMECKRTDRSANVQKERNSAMEKRKKELMVDMKHAVKRGIVFRAHEQSTKRANRASANAGRCLERVEKELGGCRDSQKKFFDARRRVSQAAVRNAKKHDIDFEQLDDSDEESYQKFA